MSGNLTLHPWNVGFEWHESGSSAKVLSSAEVSSFNNEGFVILPAALPVEEVTRAREATDLADRAREEELAEGGGRSGISEKGAITFSIHLVAENEVLKKFAKHDVFVSLAVDLVGPDVNLYWDQAVYKKPEKPRRFPWHQDNGYTFVMPQQYLTCWVPLVEATLENGCPQLAPGLHRLGTLEHTWVDPLGWQCFGDPPGSVITAAVVPGDVVVFSSLAPHLTGPNLTDDVRKAYILQYAPVGAAVLKGDPLQGEPTGRELCNNAAYQLQLHVAVGRRKQSGGWTGHRSCVYEAGGPRNTNRMPSRPTAGGAVGDYAERRSAPWSK
jgi:ectoine hydroxylase-related dioxygenase (phytanoyl-CoA dioxygenase family)